MTVLGSALERVSGREFAALMESSLFALLFKNLLLRHDHGFLIVGYEMPHFLKGTISVALEPISDREALICGLGRVMGETVRAVRVDGRELLQYSGYLL